MQNRMICYRLLEVFVLGLLMLIATSLYADSGYYYQQLPGYTSQPSVVHADTGNPWALPEKPVQAEGFRRFPGYKSYQQNNKQADEQYQDTHRQKNRHTAGRFVTPEILEKLKQQQTRTQQMPAVEQYYTYLPRSPYARFRQPLTQSVDSGLSCDVGDSGQLYNAPSISPWGSDSALRYGGKYPDSNPWVPKEAIGGLAPMNVPLLENNIYSDGIDNTYYRNNFYQQQSNAFKPYNFMP